MEFGTWLTEHALAAIISGIGAVFATILVKKAAAIMDAIETKNKIDIDDKLEQRIQDIIRSVVLAITQTYVSGLKDKGKFDSAAQKKALQDAVNKSGEIIFSELGIVKAPDELKLAVEAQIGEKKELDKVLGANNESTKFIKRRTR
jgi:hypothetical protein